jgi:pimeloyl-ACP methyl ester carboxylesterase
VRVESALSTTNVPANHAAAFGVTIDGYRTLRRYILTVSFAEFDVSVEGRAIKVRDAGDPSGYPLLYFHGTPGSRLDLAFGDNLAAEAGVRLVSFDRPGYGGSSESSFGLTSVARDAVTIADHLGIDAFATLGLSGGGPFALATALIGADRVTRVGIASGAGPFEEVPGAIDDLSEIDKQAVRYLPGDPVAAATTFASGFGSAALLEQDDDAFRSAFDPILSARDRLIFADPSLGGALIASIREGLRQGALGAGWDNVAWVGRWDINVSAISTPALLWYGDEDLMAPLVHGQWLAEHLPNAELVVREGEGHLGLFDHFAEVLQNLKGA